MTDVDLAGVEKTLNMPQQSITRTQRGNVCATYTYCVPMYQATILAKQVCWLLINVSSPSDDTSIESYRHPSPTCEHSHRHQISSFQPGTPLQFARHSEATHHPERMRTSNNGLEAEGWLEVGHWLWRPPFAPCHVPPRPPRPC